MLINESLILIVAIIKTPGHVRSAAFLPSPCFILLHCCEVSNQFKIDPLRAGQSQAQNSSVISGFPPPSLVSLLPLLTQHHHMEAPEFLKKSVQQ